MTNWLLGSRAQEWRGALVCRYSCGETSEVFEDMVMVWCYNVWDMLKGDLSGYEVDSPYDDIQLSKLKL